MREMLDKYIHKNSDGWGHNELLEVRNYINYFLSWLEKEEEKTVPKIEEMSDISDSLIYSMTAKNIEFKRIPAKGVGDNNGFFEVTIRHNKK